MTISASKERTPYNPSRAVTVNAFFIFATMVIAMAAAAAEVIFFSKSWQVAVRNPNAGASAWFADLQSFTTFSWGLVTVMLICLVGSILTLIWVLAGRMQSAGQNSVTPARVRTLGIIMLIPPIIVGLPVVFSQLMAAARMLEFVKDFDIQLPGPSMLYISFVSFLTNPINDIILLVALSPLVILFILKEFLLKDKVLTYLLNAFAAICWLVVIIFGYISVLLPFTAIINKLSE